MDFMFSGKRETSIINKVSLYPNSGVGSFFLELPFVAGKDIKTLVLDENGGIVIQKSIKSSGPLTTINFDLSTSGAGEYIVLVFVDKKFYIQKRYLLN